MEVYERRYKVWKIEALILFPDREEVTLPLALVPAQAYEVGLRALSPGGVPIGKQRRGSRLILRLQDHRGRHYHLSLKRKRSTGPQPLPQPTSST
jgi:hypothetical protein